MKAQLFSRSVLVGVAGALAIALIAGPTAAKVKPGDFITYKDAAKVKDLLPPGTYWRVINGMSMKIVPTETIAWPPPYREATEKYSGQVRIGANHRSLEGYVSGQPFPIVDANDPDVAVKIVWNMMFRPMWTDDFDARFFACEQRFEGLNNPIFDVDVQLIGHYGAYNLVGRTEVQPVPTDPVFKITNVMFMARAFPWLSPQERRGQGIIRYRYGDPKRSDDAWSYTPSTRRVRRLNESIFGDATSTLQFNLDDAEGYNPKVENYTYRFLGEKTMLGAMNIRKTPGIRCPTDGGGSVCPAEWQLRHVYVIETIPDRSRIVEELYSRHVLYIDSEIPVVFTHDQYDRKGELMVTFTNWLTYRDRAIPDARIAIYPFKRLFQVNGTSTNVQSGMSSFCDLPTPGAPERECWYINMGSINSKDFTVQAMVKAGH